MRPGEKPHNRLVNNKIMHLSMLSRGKGAGMGILTFCPNFLSKTPPLGCNAIHSRHQISAPWGESIKSKATPSGMNALSKSPHPPPRDNIDRCIIFTSCLFPFEKSFLTFLRKEMGWVGGGGRDWVVISLF